MHTKTESPRQSEPKKEKGPEWQMSDRQAVVSGEKRKVQGMCLWSPGDEQTADRHAVASGEDENEHEENIMRDIHTGKRGSATAKEEQPDKLRRTVRFEQEAPNISTSSSSTTR